MKTLFYVLTISLFALIVQFSIAEASAKDLDLSENQKEFVQGIKKKEGISNAEWSNSNTLVLTTEPNWFGNNSKEKAEKIAGFTASNISFIEEKEICVTIIDPKHGKLATVCDHDKGPE